MNHLAGRVFPGEHHRAMFNVREDGENIDFQMQSRDGVVSVQVSGHVGGDIPKSSCFSTLETASRFFEPGSLGYSVTNETGRLDGIELRTKGGALRLSRSRKYTQAIFMTRRDSHLALLSLIALC
jgi:hypothetical protein